MPYDKNVTFQNQTNSTIDVKYSTHDVIMRIKSQFVTKGHGDFQIIDIYAKICLNLRITWTN